MSLIKKHGKIFLSIAVFAAVVYVLSFSPRSNSKEISSKDTNKKAPLTEEEKEQYYLKNPFTDQDLMPFAVQSDTAIVFDVNSGKVIYSKYPDTRKPTASISKIMTALITLENANPDKFLTVSKKAAEMEPNKIVMKEGEQLKIDDLLYGLMMISANDAAEVLAEGVFGSREKFIEKMNEKAQWLGLKNTKFANPTGMDDPNHYSTPNDLGVILRYALKKYPEILKYMGEKEHSVYPTEKNESHWWQHLSSMLSYYPGMDGAKTGYTWEAGHTFLGTAQRNGKRLAIIIFNSQDPNKDVKTLLDYGFREIER